MSRASDVRDAVKAAIQSHMPGERVEVFMVPSFAREELADGPRIAVRFGAREITIDQGVDETDILIEVGVVGITPEKRTDDDYRLEEVAACDNFDGKMEGIVALWKSDDEEGDGPLRNCTMAEHSLQGIEQAMNFDADKLYNKGIWLSLVQLTYRDARD